MLTIKVAFTATAVAFCFGVVAAYLASKKGKRFMELVDSIFSLPLVLPPTVLGYYLLTLVGKKGLFGRILLEYFGVSLVFTWVGAALAASIASLPLIYKSARAAFDEVPSEIEDAAKTLGLGGVDVFLRVSFPLARRTVLAGVMLAFARAMGEFGATLMVAGNIPGKTQTLSLAVYEAIQVGDYSAASALVALTTFSAAAILIVSGRLLGGSPGRSRA